MKTILAAIDFSDASNGVLAMAKSLAKVYGAQLHLLHIIEPQAIYSAYGFAPEELPTMQIFEREAESRAIARMDALKNR